MTPAPTDDTRVDLRRPIFDAPSSPIPAAIMPDLEPDDDEVDDAATIQLSRLPWPEPPMKLAERPRLVRTDAGVAKTTSAGLRDPHPTYWRGLAIAVILAAGISIFVPRPRSQQRTAAEGTPQPPPVATAPVAQPAPAMPPPLIITVGTPPSALTATAPTTKPAIPVSKLPVARTSVAAPRPRPAAKPPVRPSVRPKPAAQPSTSRPAPAPKTPAFSAETVVDDGF